MNKENKTEWIPINPDESNLPNDLLICDWKHPEYGIIKGNLVRYGSRLESEQAWWIFPVGGSEADIALSEFTHYRKRLPVAHPSPLPESVEEFAERLAHANFSHHDSPFINYKNGFIAGCQTQHSAEVEMLRTQNEQCIEIFKWLLGYYDFPEPPKEGRPRYYWRSHLQYKLKQAGIEIKNIESPFQKRETDI
jgi:hypothetical protein